jgi:type IV pilus assembly protein PilY1
MYADYLNNIGTEPFVWCDIVSMTNTDPDVVIPELGESWSEPQFGLVKTTDTDETGTPVFFIGAGYSADNSVGKAVIAINVFTGEVVRKFTSANVDTTDMAHTTDTAINYSIASTVKIVDEDGNGFVDKVYVGDLGGQLWRFGKVLATFPDCDENINNWEGIALLNAPSYVVDSTTYMRKFYYPPSVTLERGYDLVFIGTGDREDACSTTTDADRIYCVKDAHGSSAFTETDLVDVTYPAAQPPDLDKADGDVDLNGTSDQGWFIRLVNETGLPVGEKVLAKSTVFNKVLYITTFTPNNAPCLPGGAAQLYAVNYLTGEAAIFVGTDIDGDGVADPAKNIMIGGGIPSKPVMVLQKTNQKLLISVGSTAAEATSQSLEAGVIRIDPLVPNQNFYRKWWRQFFS